MCERKELISFLLKRPTALYGNPLFASLTCRRSYISVSEPGEKIRALSLTIRRCREGGLLALKEYPCIELPQILLVWYSTNRVLKFFSRAWSENTSTISYHSEGQGRWYISPKGIPLFRTTTTHPWIKGVCL